MARDLSPLKRPLPATDHPGLDSVDSRLAAITDLASRRQFSDAADRAEALIAEGIYDIRPLSCLLVAAFMETGLSALPEVFEVVGLAVGENLGAIGPEKKREEHFDRRLAWLFETVIEAIEYHQKKRTPQWEKWTENVGLDLLEAAIDRGDDVRVKLAAGPYSTAGRTLGRLLSFFRGQAEEKRVPPVPERAPDPPREEVQEDSMQPLRRRVELVASQHFVELVGKLKAFEVLVEKGEHEKAALVADDVLATLDSFDPRDYFPELFSRFSSLVSTNIETLSGHWGNKDSVAWKALGQFYKVDLKGFVGG
jgi:hypothetical protein